MANENPPKWLPIWPGSTDHDPGGRGAVGASAVGVNGDALYWSGVSWQPFNVHQPASIRDLFESGANTAYDTGDSLTSNGLASSGSNYIARQSEGAYNWADACLGGAFRVQASLAVGGKTCRQMIDEQLPKVLAAKPRYCRFTAGTNDLYVEGASVATTYDRIIEAVEKLLDAGITPIWSTIWGRAYSASYTAPALQVNERLRRYAYLQKAGLFWDGFVVSHDPTASNGSGRSPLASYFYDNTIHPNNLLAMRMGQYCAATIGSRIYQPQRFVIGSESVTTGYAGSNLLSNPNFTGTGGTVSANCTGTMPDGWVIYWATRTGTGSAAAAIVDLTDSTTGLVIGRAVQVTISGTPASGDIVRVYQSHTENASLLTNLTSGNVIACEGQFSIASGASVSEIRMRVQTNANESTWWGVNGQTAVAYPATVPLMSCQTESITVLGSGAPSAARFDFWAGFNGNSSGTVLTFARPRFRKVS